MINLKPKLKKYGPIALLVAILIVSGVGCAAKRVNVSIVNHNDDEVFETQKDGETYRCYSAWAEQEIMQAKIDVVKPK